jgi:hypothetical protein
MKPYTPKRGDTFVHPTIDERAVVTNVSRQFVWWKIVDQQGVRRLKDKRKDFMRLADVTLKFGSKLER